MERQESDANPFPEMKLFDLEGFRYRVKRIANFLFDRVMWEGSSDHFTHPLDIPEPTNDMPVIFGFGSEGDYR